MVVKRHSCHRNAALTVPFDRQSTIRGPSFHRSPEQGIVGFHIATADQFRHPHETHRRDGSLENRPRAKLIST